MSTLNSFLSLGRSFYKVYKEEKEVKRQIEEQGLKSFLDKQKSYKKRREKYLVK